MAGAAVWALVVASVSGVGCSTSSTTIDPCPTDEGRPISDACDAIVPVFCQYAVEQCGSTETVDACIVKNRTTCCQGNCKLKVCTFQQGALATCARAYAGGDAGLEGASEADASGPADCSAVLQGFSPAPCRGVVQIKAVPDGGS